MYRLKNFKLLVVVFGLSVLGSCGGYDGFPAPTNETINTGTQQLTWDTVNGATSYNLYIHTVSGQCGTIPMNERTVSKTDTKIPNVSSPFSVSSYNACNTCYFVGVTAVGYNQESNIPGVLGFSLLPCI